MDEQQPMGVSYTTKELLSEIRTELVGVRTDVRDRFHKLAGALEGLDKRLIRAEGRADAHEKLLSDLTPTVRELAAESQVRRELEDAFEARDDRGFTRREKLTGLVLAFALIVLQVSGVHI